MKINAAGYWVPIKVNYYNLKNKKKKKKKIKIGQHTLTYYKMFMHESQLMFNLGKGALMLPDGGTYQGQFLNDKFEGKGKYIYPDKSCYLGEWKEGKRDGHGTYWD